VYKSKCLELRARPCSKLARYTANAQLSFVSMRHFNVPISTIRGYHAPVCPFVLPHAQSSVYGSTYSCLRRFYNCKLNICSWQALSQRLPDLRCLLHWKLVMSSDALLPALDTAHLLLPSLCLAARYVDKAYYNHTLSLEPSCSPQTKHSCHLEKARTLLEQALHQLPHNMGGHAFKGLYCPRVSPSVYDKVKAETKTALQTIFAQVVVPTEMPGKVYQILRYAIPSLTQSG
jgi:hypothetical protein